MGKNYYTNELGSRWQSRKMQNSLLPKNTSKIHLHMEQLSLKTNWRLAERLLYNQGFANDMSDKGLLSKYINCSYNPKSQKPTTQLINGQKACIDIFPRKIYRWPTET